MSTLAHDKNNVVVDARQGPPLGVRFTANPVQNRYYRLMPSSKSAKRLSGSTLLIGAWENGTYGAVDEGIAFPTGPTVGDVFRFNADVASGLTWSDYSGTALTAASENDVARWNGALWIQQRAFRNELRHMPYAEWQLRIFNQGYQSLHEIERIENESIVHIRTGLRDHPPFRENLPQFLEICLFPRMIGEFVIRNDSGSSNDVNIGSMNQDVYEPDADNTWFIERLNSSGLTAIFKTNRPDRFVYRYTDTVATSDNDYLSWGEHISIRG